MPEESQSILTEEAIKALFLYAETKIDDRRVSEQLDNYSELLAMSRNVLFQPLGETPPASAFKASWE